AVALQLLPVVLGDFLVPRPHDRTSIAVDAVGDAQALVIGHLGQGRGQRGRDTLEGVVVVVQDDDVPRSPETRPGAVVDSLFGRRSHRPIVVTSRPVSTVTYDVEAVRARYSALRR